jgi:hypothetical protein
MLFKSLTHMIGPAKSAVMVRVGKNARKLGTAALPLHAVFPHFFDKGGAPNHELVGGSGHYTGVIIQGLLD